MICHWFFSIGRISDPFRGLYTTRPTSQVTYGIHKVCVYCAGSVCIRCERSGAADMYFEVPSILKRTCTYSLG
jgi:hypothetical protein